MLDITCDYCREALEEPGALLFAPPQDGGTMCRKYHICVSCVTRLYVVPAKEKGAPQGIPEVTVRGKRCDVVVDSGGTLRFRQNKCVQKFLDAASNGDRYSMNSLQTDYQRELFTTDDMLEFYRLIGYSIGGYEEIFSDEVIQVKPA